MDNESTLLYTKREAAKELRCSERTIHSLIQSGGLPAVRFGGSVRVSRDDLIQFVNKSRRQTPAADSNAALPQGF